MIIIIVVVISSFFVSFNKPRIAWGVTFSQPYAQYELGLDWQKTYLAILDDLKVDHIRLSAYWNDIEIKKGVYDFTNLDWQINEANKRQVKIILAVGRRLPRWPECHDPNWVSSTPRIEVENRQLSFVEAVVKRYQNNPNIIYWQVENEPLLSTFGVCPQPDKNFFKKEIKLVKSLVNKPILVTDSGELSTWVPIALVGGDILGSTLYRVVHNSTIGYWHWFLPPAYYYLKAEGIKIISPVQKVIVAELQAEAWHKQYSNLSQMTLDEYFESMSLEQFKSNIKFTKRAGFDEAYLWGVEWWYFMKEKRSYDGYWQEAKTLWPQAKQ
ncbi:MAG: beta-galactosidase [Patescibacteria group bacterium]